MENLQIIIAGLTAVILFVFGLEHFSQELERISGERFRRFLGKATRIPIVGVIIGALVTAVIQSSSATSVITIGLVNAGVLSFKSSIGIILGSNVGTTVTAQLVAFKLTDFAPYLIIAGFVLSLVRSRWSIFGKSVFYFGFVFFSLNLISSTLAPLRDNPTLIAYLTEPHHAVVAVLAGALVTAVLQSSSVTTGLAIIFTQQGILSLDNAVPLIMGANIGTTATALVAMFNMDTAAQKTALSHFLFNVGGVVLCLPLFMLFGDRLNQLEAPPAVVLAAVHMVFNVFACAVFLVFLNPFARLVEGLLGSGRMDFQRLAIPAFDEARDFAAVRAELDAGLGHMLDFLRDTYNQVTLSIETNYRSVYDAAAKRIDYFEFAKREYLGYFSRLVPWVKDEEDTRDLLRTLNLYDYLFQVHDSIEDLFFTKRVMRENYIEPSTDILILVREISGHTLSLFEDVSRVLEQKPGAEIAESSAELKALLDRNNRELLSLMNDPARRDAGALTNFVTYSRRLQDKLVNFVAVRASTRPAGD
jgi:phosphate:Na+ symporter